MSSLNTSAKATSSKPLERTNLLNEYRLSPDAEEGIIYGLDPPKKPWKKVALAISLLIFGSIMLIIGVVMYMSSQPNGIPLMVIGSLAFIPGLYYTRHAYLAWRGYRGYTLASIPDV